MIGAAISPAGILSTTSSEGQILRTTASGALMIAIAIFRPDGLISVSGPFKKRVKQTRASFARKNSNTTNQSRN